MSGSLHRLAGFIVTIGLALAAGLSIGPVVRHGVSSSTAGFLVGAFGTLCLAGLAFGIWDARRIEARRKANERVWIRH